MGSLLQMWYLSWKHVKLTSTPSRHQQRQAAIERLLSQQRLEGAAGIRVRLTSQNQVFLDTWRPTRVAIPASLLEKTMPSFKIGRKAFIRATYGQSSVYHYYGGGQTWVPTVPESVGKPNDVFEMSASHLTRKGFVASFPRIGLGTARQQAWMTGWSEIALGHGGGRLELEVTQDPPVEGVSRYTMVAKTVGSLAFQKGSVFTVVEVKDVFSVPRYFQFHHNGHRRAWISLNRRKSSQVRLLSFDGYRLRIKSRLRRRYSSTVLYMRDPAGLYSFEKSTTSNPNLGIQWADTITVVHNVAPRRELEQMIVRHADWYETGRIGAEITYSILKEKMGVRGLILHEPGRWGPDVETGDGRIVAESRFIAQVGPDEFESRLFRDLAQMARKTRREFRYDSKHRLGYIVISYFNGDKIDSLVVSLAS